MILSGRGYSDPVMNELDIQLFYDYCIPLALGFSIVNGAVKLTLMNDLVEASCSQW